MLLLKFLTKCSSCVPRRVSLACTRWQRCWEAQPCEAIASQRAEKGHAEFARAIYWQAIPVARQTDTIQPDRRVQTVVVDLAIVFGDWLPCRPAPQAREGVQRR